MTRRNKHIFSYFQEYIKLRLAHVDRLKKQGENPYPHKFNVTISLEAYIAKYADTTKDGESLPDVVSVAGKNCNTLILTKTYHEQHTAQRKGPSLLGFTSININMYKTLKD